MEVIAPSVEEPKAEEWKTATTISTIAVQAEPHSRIVVAMLKSIGYVELRIDEMKPKLLEIGKNLSETSHLLNSHTDLFSRLMSKQQQVEELLIRAHDLVNQQTEQDDVIVYEAMADGLSIAWRELSRQLELRGYILTDTHAFYELAERHENLNNHTSSLLRRVLGTTEGSQVSSPPSDLAGIVQGIHQAIYELIGITAAAVDVGSNIISQIRVVGSLADNAERAEEVVEACLTIEKVMLKMAQQWEIIDNFWTVERTKLEAMVGSLECTSSREKESSEHLQAHMNAAEAWLNAAKQTYHSMEQTYKTANQLLDEVKNQKEKLCNLNFTKHTDTDLAQRQAKLMKDFDVFAKSLEEITQLSNRVQHFLQNADLVLNQLNHMAGDLANANAAIAGELGPLAHQKAGVLIDEGEHLLGLEPNEYVAEKVEELKVRLTEVETMARERIALAKTNNQKLQAQLSTLNSWLKDLGEAFLTHNGDIGADYSSCVNFLSKHKKFAADVMNKEQDVISVLSHSQELAAADRQIMSEFQKKYEHLRHLLEHRLKLGRNFEQVQKFSKELNNSFVTLSNLLSSSNQSNFATHDSIGQQIRNVIQLVQETLQQERHLGEKFIANARSVATEDVHLSIEPAIEAVQFAMTKHQNNLMDFSQRWEDWEKSRFEVKKALEAIEKVQMWQIETQELIRIIETQIHQQLLINPESRQHADERLQKASEQAYMQRQRLQQNAHHFNQQLVIDSSLNKFSVVEQRQQELEDQLFNLRERVSRPIAEETFIETQETFRAPNVISQLQDAEVVEGSRFSFSATIGGTPMPQLSWTKDSLDIHDNANYKTSFLNGVAILTIEETFIEDSAVYKIRAENSFGSAESCARLDVKAKNQLSSQLVQEPIGEKPYFIKPLQNVNVIEGETATVDCVLVARPEPQVIWFKEEHVLQESERVRLLFRGDHCILCIIGISTQDSGLYMVKAVNALGESTNFCRINVLPASVCKVPPKTPPKPATPTINVAVNVQQPKAPYLQPSLANQTVNEGDRVQFQIHVGGAPAPDVRWSFQDRAIPPQDSNVQVFNEGDGWTRLIVERADPKYAGIYMVVAMNDFGESRSGASLNVIPLSSGTAKGELFPSVRNVNQIQEAHTTITTSNAQQQLGGFLNSSPVHEGIQTPPPPVPRHRNQQITISDYLEKDIGDMGYSSIANAPEFIKPFQNEYTVDEGEKVKIDCLMVGNPRPRVHWFFNDRPVKSNYQIVELTNIGDTYSIGFTPAKLENAGYYRMCAENIRGKTESLTLIHVRPRSMIPHPMPKMLKKTQSYEPQRLMDDLYGQRLMGGGTPPPPKKAHPIASSSSTTAISTSYYQPKHSFATDYNNSGYSNQQQYLQHPTYKQPTFTQSTAAQESGSELMISGQPPHFTQTLVSIVGTVGEMAKFEAVVTGSPLPTPQWTKDGLILSRDTSPEAIFSNIGNRFSLVFPTVTLEDAGKYMCTARNTLGVATSSAQLVVRARTIAPDFTKRLISEEVMEGDTLKWNVQINGDPEPKVTWLRDGQLIPNCEEVKLVREGNGVYSMIIQQVEAADGGQFTCLLENEAGEARSTADLVVRPTGSKPGSYFHITKVTQEKQLKGEEVSRNQTFSIENPRLHTNTP